MESAIVLPLAVFLILGTLQLFLMLHGRILAEYAVFKATRAGSVNGGDCEAMTHAAIAALLPAVSRTDDVAKLTVAFNVHRFNRYIPGMDGPRFGPIVWIVKKADRDLGRHPEETFDDKTLAASRAELLVDMVFWFPLKIPFADWVMGRMFLAAFGGLPYTNFNPLSPTQTDVLWKGEAEAKKTLTSKMKNELRKRILMGQYVAPIRTSYRMRFMTPALFMSKKCPNSPSEI